MEDYRKVKPDLFKKIIDKVRESGDMFKGNITDYSKDDYQKFTTYLSPDGKSGYAIKPDGELISVFSLEKGRGKGLVKSAVESGAKKLDAFDIGGKLPKLYGEYFDEVDRLKFDDKYAPKDWNYKALGRPDVVDMKVNPSKLKGTSMSTMADKEALEFLRKMAREGNIESRLKDSNDAVGRVAGIDFPKGIDPKQTDVSIKRRVLEAMKRPAGMKAPAEEAMAEGLEKLLKKAAVKSAGKAALAGVTGGLSLAAEAADSPEAGEPSEVRRKIMEDNIIAKGGPEAEHLLKVRKGKAKFDAQDPEDAKRDVQIMRDKVQALVDAKMTSKEREAMAEDRMRSTTKEEAVDARTELNRMLLDNGLLK